MEKNSLYESNKIIFINRFYWPDHSATSQLLSELAPAIAEENIQREVHIIASRLLYSDSSFKLEAEQEKNNVRIHRIFTSRFGRFNLLGRSIDYLSFYLFVCIKLFFIADKKSIVVVKTDPPMLSVPCRIITKLRGSRQINWLQDIYPEIVEAMHPDKLPKFFLKFLIKIRNISLKSAAINVVISEDMKSFLINEGVSSNKLIVIENWVDTDLIKPIAKKDNDYVKKWGLENKTVIMYSGNMGRSHYLNEILYVAEKFKHNKDIKFLFVGDGAQRVTLEKMSENLSLDNVFFEGYQSKECLSQSLSVADIHIVSLKKELSNFIYPSKLYGILATGRPVLFLGNEDSAIANHIKNNDVGYVVNINEIEKMYLIINNYNKNKDINVVGEKARTLAVNYHDIKIAIRNWDCLIKNLINGI